MRSLTLVSVSSLLIFSSCGKVNDMHDATMDMSETTKNMAKTTDGMSKTTDGMSKTTDHMSTTTDKMSKTTDRMDNTTCKMYTSLRQGNSKASRDTDIKEIIKSKNITEKLELAAKYMQGFEFQVWTSSCAETSPREILIDQAATELLTTVEPFVENRGNVSATNQSSAYNTLYALAATLHRVNSLQEFYLSGTGEKILTPQDILLQGLKLNQQKNRGEFTGTRLPVWATTVGKYEKDAEFILRLRANFLMAYGYAVADSDQFGDVPNLLEKAARLTTVKFFGKKWKPNLAKRDPTEIRERIIVSLRLAKETRDALVKLGIDPMTSSMMMQIWKAADFSKIDLTAMAKEKGIDGEKSDGPARADAIRELISARDALFAAAPKAWPVVKK